MSSVGWWILGVLATMAFVAFVALIVRSGARPYKAERAIAAQLAQSGHPAQGQVVSLDRQPGGELYAAPMTLGVCYTDAAGQTRRTSLSVYIDSELLSRFMPGQTVHLRYDLADPARIAVDRMLTPTEIRAAWRKPSR